MANALRQNMDANPADTIRSLAMRNGVVAERALIDDLADAVSNLAGDQVMHDEIEDLVVAMQRKGIISGEQAVALYGDYLKSL